MALLSSSSSSSMLLTKRFTVSPLLPSNNTTIKTPINSRTRAIVCACFNPFEDQPIIKDALKEPVAFMGGVFAGLLRLDLNEDPLKEWIAKTVEAAGVSPEELASAQEAGLGGEEDEGPQQIEIE